MRMFPGGGTLNFVDVCVCVERVTESNGESLPQATATTNGSHFQPMLFFVCFFFFLGVKLYFM